MTNEVKIIFYNSANTATGEILLPDDFAIPITYQLNDISDFEKSQSSKSKDVILKGSSEVNKIFSHLYNINTNVSLAHFDVNHKQKCIVFQNSLPILRGYMQLLDINKISHEAYQDEDIQYSIRINEDKSDIFNILGDKLITELDLSEYNHTKDFNIITASTSNTYLDGYIYPNFYNSYNTYYSVSDFNPSLFVLPIVNKIFENINFSHSGFLNEQPFIQDLIIPYTGDKPLLNENSRLLRKFKVSHSGTSWYENTKTGKTTNSIVNSISALTANLGQLTKGTNATYNDDSTYPNFDSGNTFNSSTYKWIVNATGHYDLDLQLRLNTIISAATDGWSVRDGCGLSEHNIYIQSDNSKIQFEVVVVKTSILDGTKKAYYQGSANLNKPYRAGIPTVFTTTNGPDITGGTIYSSNTDFEYTIKNKPFLSGDTIEVYVSLKDTTDKNLFWSAGTASLFTAGNPQYHASTALIRSTIKTKIDDARIGIKSYTVGSQVIYYTAITNNFSNEPINRVDDGDYIEINKFLPKEKQKELISNLVRKFNLFVFVDPNNDRRLIFKNRDDFYSAYTTHNITKLLDLGQPQNIKFLSELQDKKIQFTDAIGDDFYSKEYSAKTGYIYGAKEFELEYDFTQSTKIIGTTFQTCPIIKNKNDNLLVSYIDSRVPKTKWKLLHLNREIGNWQFKKYSDEGVIGSDVSPIYTFTGYTTATHLDSPNNPTFDLNYGTNDYLYYNTNIVTDNNAYNLYWSSFFNQLINGKLFTAYFNINERQISEWKFNDRYQINDSIFILNKIIDYNPLSTLPTKCEFIRIDSGIQTFQPSGQTQVSSGGIKWPIDKGVVSGAVGVPLPNPNVINIINPDSLVSTNGTGNVIDIEGPGLVVGDENVIVAGTENAVVIGSNNNIGGANNVIIMDNNIVITSQTESNTAYIYGIKINNGTISDYSGNTVTIASLTAITAITGLLGFTGLTSSTGSNSIVQTNNNSTANATNSIALGRNNMSNTSDSIILGGNNNSAITINHSFIGGGFDNIT